MKMCESCGENPATIMLTQVEGRDTHSRHICTECAEKMGINVPDPLREELDSFEEYEEFDEEQEEFSSVDEQEVDEFVPPEKRCYRCGKKESAFQKDLQAGCRSCYDTFDGVVREKLRANRRSRYYHGKPYHYAKTKGFHSEIEYLRYELDRAVKKQKYELAAVLRDKIHRMETGL
ncbi:UvrB/UvrC motif-containing protein [Chitinivibrio alkaliphilus]|uniref:UvrB/UvrC protein n=1 Tax=Chitinivibrio alkaliphilus ACht1 TaxID=1313304 RepID=U7D9M1_9BACT|nr:UvrB/UvrC motif-containing protein [Chitinivibrio alkaliphilus]ERP38722.1 UvrB/UvrC protein [Chitinivibrio alkaliphilus ACht1]